MTSNSPGKERAAARVRTVFVFLVGAFLAGSSLEAQQQAPPADMAPDAPRPPRVGAAESRKETPGGVRAKPTVELKAVHVRRLDAKMAKLAGSQFVKTAAEPYFLEVQTATPLGNLSRSSAPVILLNGEKLLNTRATGERTLVAFLPDRKMLKGTNAVGVVWLGDQRTQTRRPLTFTLGELVP